MNYKLLSIIGALLLGCGLATAQNFEDDIYYDGSSQEKTKTVTKKAPTTSGYSGYMTTQVTPLSGVVNGRDVDEYNRRTDGYYDESDTTYLDGEDFANTRRIERFHNPDIVIRSNDPDLIEYYFDNTPTVNLIVGSGYGVAPYWGWSYRYYDPWYSINWGWHYPWRYGGWYDWYGWGYWGWSRPWIYSNWGWHNHWAWNNHWGGWNRPGRGWYGDHGFAHGIGGRRPGLNYHGNRGNMGSNGVQAVRGRSGGMSNGINGNRGVMNHGNLNINRGFTGGRTATPGNRSYNGGGNVRQSTGGTVGRTYNGGGTMHSAPKSSSGGYSGGSRSSGGFSGGGRSGGGYSGGGHSSGGGFSGGGGSHGGGGGGSHGGRR